MKLIIGEKFPNFEFDTPICSGNKLYNVIANKPATIIFFRDSGCLFTAYYIEKLKRNYNRFEDSNRAIICIVQGTPSEFYGYKNIPFPIVCDAESVLYNTFELPKVTFPLSLLSVEALRIIDQAKKHNIPFEYSLKNNGQLPVIVLTHADKTIDYIHRSQSITDIPDILELLGANNKNKTYANY